MQNNINNILVCGSAGQGLIFSDPLHDLSSFTPKNVSLGGQKMKELILGG